ncbi:MAG: tetratricopeptide repeat protein [Christensenellaceae bacterium]|jgi:tetratricopeptide (TPR) repeat protein|nr:tetratricopeptide repeat protein [Christensenellaceae bacterium]
MPKDRVVPFEADSRFFHRRAVRLIDKQDFLSGLRNLRRAQKLDPVNVDIALDLADAYARMGLFEQSNTELGLLLHREDCPEEVMFAMGCNYMAMGDYAQAYSVFENYLNSFGEGEFAYLARDGMEQIEESEIEDGIDRELEDLAERGKAALDAGDPSGAAELFREVLARDESLSYVRNNLALAYICMEEMPAAWEQLRIILKQDALNVHACCNAALLFKNEGQAEKAARMVARLNPEIMEEIDELYKYCLSMAELSMEGELMQGLKRILLLCPYESTMLYLSAVCQYNEGRFDVAIKQLERALLAEPSHVLALHLLECCQARLSGGQAPEKFPLSFEYGPEQRGKIDERLAGLISMYADGEGLRAELERDETLVALEAALQGEDEMVAKAVVVLAAAGGAKAEEELRRLLLSPIHSDGLKQMGLDALVRIGAKKPFFAMIGGRMVQMVNAEIRLNALPPKPYAELMRESVTRMHEEYQSAEAMEYAVETWTAYLNFLEGHFPPIRGRGGWLAAVKAGYEKFILGTEPDFAALAKEYGATERTIRMRMGRFFAARAAAGGLPGDE